MEVETDVLWVESMAGGTQYGAGNIFIAKYYNTES